MVTTYQFVSDEEGRFAETPTDEHFAAIGRFILTFSGIEIAMVRLFRDLLNVPDLVAMALQGDGRPASSAKLIRRLFDLAYPDDERAKRLQGILADIAALKVIRDNLAHRPFACRGERMAFFGGLTAKTFSFDCDFYSVEELLEGAEFADLLSEGLADLIRTLPHTRDEFPEFHQAWGDLKEVRLQALKQKPALLKRTRSHTSAKSKRR